MCCKDAGQAFHICMYSWPHAVCPEMGLSKVSMFLSLGHPARRIANTVGDVTVNKIRPGNREGL